MVGMWKIWLGFARFRSRFGSDLGDAVGIWDVLFGFWRFGRDAGDLAGIWKICLGFARFGWALGDLIGIWEIWLGFGMYFGDLAGI